MVGEVCGFISFHVGSKLSHGICWKSYIFHNLLKSIAQKHKTLLPDFELFAIDTYLYSYVNTIWSCFLYLLNQLEIRKYKSSNFFPPGLFWIFWSIDQKSNGVLIHSYMNFRISLSVSWDFDQDCVESVDQLGEYCHLR